MHLFRVNTDFAAPYRCSSIHSRIGTPLCRSRCGLIQAHEDEHGLLSWRSRPPEYPTQSRRSRRTASEPGHAGRGSAHHFAQRDRLGCRAGRRGGGLGHPAPAQHAGARDRHCHSRSRHGRQSKCHFTIHWRRDLVDPFRYSGLSGRRLRGRATVRAAQGGDRGLAWPHRLGLYHVDDLLPAQLDRRRGAGWGLQHGQWCDRRPWPHGCNYRGRWAPALSQMADPMAAIESSVRDASGGNDPAALRDAAVTAMRAVLTGDQAQAQEARERAAAAIARAQNIPIEDARTQVTGYEQQYRQTVEQARQQATEAADTAATVVSRGALFGFFALALWCRGGLVRRARGCGLSDPDRPHSAGAASGERRVALAVKQRHPHGRRVTLRPASQSQFPMEQRPYSPSSRVPPLAAPSVIEHRQ